MISYVTLRTLYRIPWIRNNNNAIQILNKMFYLLLALHRMRRYHDFCYLYKIYFWMIESFILYGRGESKDFIEQLLNIPWFKERRYVLYRSIVAYKRVIKSIQKEESEGPSIVIQREINKNIKYFVVIVKILIDFDKRDENRINSLVRDPSIIDHAFQCIYKLGL